MSVQNQNLLNALQCHKQGKFQEAEILYKKALEEDSRNDRALYYLGILYFQAGHSKEAIDLINKSIEAKPDVEKYKELAEIYLKISMKAEAMDCYQRALQLNVPDAGLFFKIGIFFFQEGIYEDALKSLQTAVDLAPDHPEINYVLAMVLHNIRDYNRAIFHYEKSIEQAPNNENAYQNLGLVCYYTNQFDKSVEYFKKALELNPNNAGVHRGLGVVYQDSYRYDEAIKCYEKSLELEPDNLLTKYNLGRTLISNGNIEKGWVYFDDARINMFEHHKLKFPPEVKPKWNGEPLQGKTIYVYNSGGCGDDMLFTRYIPELRKLGAKIIVKARWVLVKIFKDSNLEAEIIDEHDPDPTEFDYQIPTMSLGRAFNGILDLIPGKDGYLKHDPELAEKFKAKYFNNNSFKIGITWRCQDPERSLGLEHFRNISKIPNVQLYSIQTEFGKEEMAKFKEEFNIIDLSYEIKDFQDTASLIANFDLSISIDTAALHLTGALGQPVWGLTKYSPYWGWACCRNENVWYNSVRLFEQKQLHEWSEVLERVEKELRIMLDKG